MKIAYLCDGKAECALHPGCVYREEPISKTDYVCKHTFDSKHAKNGICIYPEDYPERFQAIDLGDHDVCFWEKHEGEQ